MKTGMRNLSFSLTLIILSAASCVARAEPAVVASIKPIHSLVAAVMGDRARPSLIVKGAASPHDYALRPSEAAALQEARLVFWIGHELEAFLEGPLESLSGDATVIALGEVEGLVRLDFREGGAFEGHAGEGHLEGDHAGGDHAEQDHDGEGHGGHGHEGFDPHIWLDPVNARVMVSAIADALIEADPENAVAYRENALAMIADLEALQVELGAKLKPVHDRSFIVFHDAFQYLENRYDLHAAGAMTVNPAVRPSVARVAEIRDHIREAGAACVFAEPQFDTPVIETVIEGSGARLGVIDPLGAELQEGAGLYRRLLETMVGEIRRCLGASG